MIKFAASLLLVFTAFAVAQTNNSGSLSGKWKVTSTIAGNESTSDCTFTQTENDLSGTCTNDQGSVKIAGKIDGTKIVWSYASDYNGTPLTVKYSGKLGSGKITGEATVDPFGVSGDFTATPVKQGSSLDAF